MEKSRHFTTGHTTRRNFLQGVTAATLGLASGAAPQLAWAKTRGTIKIGCLDTFTKAASIYGNETLDGLKLYFEHMNWHIAGRKVEIIKEDSEFNPQVGLEKVRKLIESDHVQVLCGPLDSAIAMAMAGYMKSSGVPWLVTGAGSTALTKKRIPHMYRTTLSNWQVAYPMGSWLYKHKAKNAAIVAADFVAGHDVARAFKESFVKEGGVILKELYPPLGTNDFSAYISEVLSTKPQAVYTFFAGIDSARFVKQSKQFGLSQKTIMAGFQSVYDSATLPAEGQAALGALSSSIYCDLIDTPENKQFVALYRKRYKTYPGVFSESGYTTGLIIDEAARAVHGDIENANAFSAAVGSLKINAARGPVRFDPITHQAIQNVYIRKVVDSNGHLDNEVVATIPHFGDKPSNRT